MVIQSNALDNIRGGHFMTSYEDMKLKIKGLQQDYNRWQKFAFWNIWNGRVAGKINPNKLGTMLEQQLVMLFWSFSSLNSILICGAVSFAYSA